MSPVKLNSFSRKVHKGIQRKVAKKRQIQLCVFAPSFSLREI